MLFLGRLTLRAASLILTLLAIFMMSLLPSQSAFASPSRFDAIDRYVEYFMQQNRVPGLALAIVQGSQVAYLHGYGLAGPSGQPVTPQTPFILGSTSKSFTALAVMQLVEAGKVNLDAPVTAYLPWFKVGSDGTSDVITVRQLLNQTSGIPAIAGEATLYMNDSSADALERQVRRLSQWGLDFWPGTNFEYSNANYQTVGLIVQVVSKEPFEDYVRQHIFSPLDMQHSYTDKPTALANGLASGYHYWFGFPLPAGNTPYPREHFPSGFYISCAQDMAHALVAHLNNGIYAGTAVVSPAGMEILHQPAQAGYAMGWMADNFGVLSHTGAVADYGSYILIDPKSGIGVAVLFNINNAIGAAHLYTVGNNIWALLTGNSLVVTPAEDQYTKMGIGLVALLIVSIAWFAWSLRIILHSWRRYQNSPISSWKVIFLILPLAAEGLISFFLWQQFTTGLLNALLFQPDFSILILIISFLLVGWGVIRSILVARLALKKLQIR